MAQGVVRDGQHFFHARQLGGGLRGFVPGAGDENMDRRAESGGGGQSLGGGVVEVAVVDFGEKKSRHQSTPASFLSLPTRSATDPTFTPALRLEGSVVFSTFSRGATSTP